MRILLLCMVLCVLPVQPAWFSRVAQAAKPVVTRTCTCVGACQKKVELIALLRHVEEQEHAVLFLTRAVRASGLSPKDFSQQHYDRSDINPYLFQYCERHCIPATKKGLQVLLEHKTVADLQREQKLLSQEWDAINASVDRSCPF